MHKLIQNQPEDFTAKLSPKYNFSSPFSLIRSPLEFSTFFPCQHDSFISIASDLGNCKDCGVYLNRVKIFFSSKIYNLINKSCNTFGLKTKKNSFKLDIASKPIMENFLKTSIRTPVFSGSSSYLKNRASLIDWLFEMARKLDLSLNTAHLAILFLDLVMAQDQEDLIPIHLFSTTSLLLAGKKIILYSF